MSNSNKNGSQQNETNLSSIGHKVVVLYDHINKVSSEQTQDTVQRLATIASAGKNLMEAFQNPSYANLATVPASLICTIEHVTGNKITNNNQFRKVFIALHSAGTSANAAGFIESI